MLLDPFTEEQGVRQGEIISPSAYKTFRYPLLYLFQKSNPGTKIGLNYCGTPTCADDVLLLADTASDLQAMLNIQESSAKAERYASMSRKPK